MLYSLTPIKSASGFTPEQLAFDFLFYNEYTASGGDLTTWVDKAGSNNGTPATAGGVQVIAADSTINNRPSFTFSSVNGGVNFAGSTSLANPSAPFTAVVVHKLTTAGAATTAFRGLLSLVTAIPGGFFYFVSPGVGAPWQLFSMAFTDAVPSTARRESGTADDVWQIGIIRYAGAGGNINLEYNRNNAPAVLIDAGSTTTVNTQNRIGAGGTVVPDSLFPGSIAFAAGGQFYMSNTEMADLYNWFNFYYGL